MVTAIDSIVFPRRLMREEANEWNIHAATAAPPQTAAGAFPIVRLDGGGLWIAKANAIWIGDEVDARAFRAVRMLAQQGAMPVIVPRNEGGVPPFPAGYAPYGSIPHSDGSLFADGGGYAQSVIDVRTVASAELRDTSLTLDLINCGELSGGMSFSIHHETQGWRLYEIKTAVINDDGGTEVTFEPPLREAVGAGEYLEFDQPRCVMRLMAPDAMNFRLTVFPFTIAGVSFVETFFTS